MAASGSRASAVAEVEEGDISRIAELVEQYVSLPLGIVDAASAALQGAVISWTVPEFLDLLRATAKLPALRQKLRWFLASCRK
jgi:hypothetical protein